MGLLDVSNVLFASVFSSGVLLVFFRCIIRDVLISVIGYFTHIDFRLTFILFAKYNGLLWWVA